MTNTGMDGEGDELPHGTHSGGSKSAVARDQGMPNAPTIRLRRSKERGFEDFGWTDNWMTFSFADYHDPEWTHYGPLRVMVENHIQPHSGFSAHPHRDVEIVTYVAAGTLTHGDSFGHKAGITAGEMQHISAGSRGMIHSEENEHDVVEHNYQMWLVPNRHPSEFAYHQLKFSPEERQGRLRLYVSPDGRHGSMPVNTNAFIYAGLFDEGDDIEHVPDGPGRGAWIQVVRGRVDIRVDVRLGADPTAEPDGASGSNPTADPNSAPITLYQGDGAGISDVERIRLHATEPTELLLFDVKLDEPMIWK